MEVKIISRETIRPSSPTPPHLKLFHLSLLDQFSPLYYVPAILFYHLNDSSNVTVNQILNQLKESLSKTLSIFYPLAGRIKDHLSIDCNDEGVLFAESRVSCHLLEFLRKPRLDLLYQFLPGLDISSLATPSLAFQVAIQVNVFSSGGIAIGLRLLHRIIDAATIKAFVKCWTAIASGSNEKPTYPNFAAASVLFPAKESKDDFVPLLEMSWLLKKEKGVWRRFVFNSAAISSLKDKAASEAVPNPTRSEVIAAFIWERGLGASRALSSPQLQPSTMIVTVDIRAKTVPPMPGNSIGNIIWQATAHHKAEELELKSVTAILRQAVNKFNGDYTRSLQGEEGLATAIGRSAMELREMYFNQTPDVYSYSSLFRFGFYEMDFGWGKPAWIALSGEDESSPIYSNAAFLIETNSGEGIEAWVLMAESHMAKLE